MVVGVDRREPARQTVPGEGDARGDIVSVVSATVRTQLEFNSPELGFVRRPGTSEFILEIRTPAPPASP